MRVLSSCIIFLAAVTASAGNLGVTLVAGSGTAGQDNGTGASASFDRPSGVAVDSNGNMFVADQNNHTIRKITPQGVVTVFAGAADTPGSTTGVNGTAARFNGPAAISIDSSNNLWVADTQNCTIRKITSSGDVTTPVGAAGLCDDSADSSGASSRLRYPRGVFAAASGDVFIADTENNKIRRMNTSQNVFNYSTTDYSFPYGLTMDGLGNLYVADSGTHTIKKIAAGGGAPTVFAGSSGMLGTEDGTGSAARFRLPQDVVFDGAELVVADSSNHAIRRVTLAGVVTTVAGLKGTSGGANGVASTARFNRPEGITYAGNGEFIIAEGAGHRIRRGVLFGRLPNDFDAEGISDRAVFRPSTNVWWIRPSSASPVMSSWGVSGDVAVAEDYDGDGKSDVAIWRPSTSYWWIKGSAGVTSATLWGASSDIPVPGDYDGDGKADLAVWRPGDGNWWVKNSGGGATQVAWGLASDTAVPADYDGDGRTDRAVWRPSEGRWWIRASSGPISASPWGLSGDIPVPGDYDGDLKADLAVWRPSTQTFWIKLSAGGATATRWGQSGDQPVVGDWDGDGKRDLTIWRPADGSWWTRISSGGISVNFWGVSGDQPISE